MTDQELRDLVAESSRAVARMSEEAEKSRLEAEKSRLEAEKRSKELNKQLSEVGREIGWIGNSWGRFTEGLFTPSLDRILLREFDMETVAHRVKRQRNGSSMEVDVLGYTNSQTNTAVVVEIKSTLRDDDIKDFLDMLEKFPKLFVEHKNKKILGMMAAVSISTEQRARLEKNGIYVVRIKDDVFRIISDKKFKPKDFGLKE